MSIDLEPGDRIIVFKADGTMLLWAQDHPELERMMHVEQVTSTCDCEHDVCPADEMPGWNQHLLKML